MITEKSFASRSSDQHRSERRRQQMIGKELRRLYADVVTEGVPDNLIALLQQVDQREKT